MSFYFVSIALGSLHLGVFFVLCKDYKKDIFHKVIMGFEPIEFYMVLTTYYFSPHAPQRTSQGKAVTTHEVRITFRVRNTSFQKRKRSPMDCFFVFVLYSQFRCHSKKVNKIKDF